MVSAKRCLRLASCTVLLGLFAGCAGSEDERTSAADGDDGSAVAASRTAETATRSPPPANAFASKARIPGDARRDAAAALEVSVIDGARVPSKGEVGVPPYPGAVVVGSTTAEEARQMYGEEAAALPLVRLLSEDPPATVAAYYRERLGGEWHYAEKFGSHYFWAGEPDLGMPELMDPAQRRIQIGEADGWRVLPGARSDIFIVYGEGR